MTGEKHPGTPAAWKHNSKMGTSILEISSSATNYPMFTIEQIELIRRLRNSGITKEQVVEAFERFDRIDQELGLLYTVPSSGASPSSTATASQTLNVAVTASAQSSVTNVPTTTTAFALSQGAAVSRSNGQYSLYTSSRPSFSSSSPQSDNGQSDLKPPSNKRPREECSENNHDESLQENSQRAHNSVHNSMSLGGGNSLSTNRSLSYADSHSTITASQNSTVPNSLSGTQNSPASRVNDSMPSLASGALDDSQLAINLENNPDLEIEELQEFMKQGMTKMYEEIKAFVNRVGLKQSQIAAMTGISQSYVSRYLRGEFTEMSERCRRAMYAWYVSHRQRLARAPRFSYGTNGFKGMLSSGGDAMDIQFTPKRERFTFREKHLEVLEAYFKENQYPSMELREEIAHLCNMALSSTGRELCEKEKVTPQIVSNWFNNRRKEMKKLAKEGGLDCSQILLPSRVRQRSYMIDLENQGENTTNDRICTPSPKPSEGNDEHSSFAADVAAVNRAISALSGEPLDGPIQVKQEPVSDSDEKSQSSQHSLPIAVE
ncbi:homeobox-containing protein 1-like isoform X2 [Octopus sinensis]|uniref:Homeobox-containing protein 1-like isoform X2 n=1 Tax=Octopus sinensis TaxID=2607531 RepID=A0A7E6FAR9_9MOLL|nr:homeobox-containing protein 1-like isoform X2 [Octopus sinensis]